jgi:predicted transposase/invertase (TIGR01784 family)
MEQQEQLEKVSRKSPYNGLENFNSDSSYEFGIIACGIGYNYVKECDTDDSPVPVLKVSQYPLPAEEIQKMADCCKYILVVEDGQPFVEEQVKALLSSDYTVKGRLTGDLPRTGELTPDNVGNAIGWATKSPFDFLNDLLVGERSIKDITFLDKELLPEYMGDRGVIYDIYCTTEAGEHIIVEMQNRQQTNFKERALFYLSHTITRQGEKGARWEFDLKAVYGVFFMNFRLEDTPHKLRTDIVLSDRDTHEVFSDKLRFIFIELPSFNKEEEECETDFERWIYILKNMETLNRLPFKARKAVFEKLEKIVDIASLSKEERMKYDESIKVYRDNLATISFAKNQGKEEGLKEGIEKGLKEGRKEGRKEGILSVARNLRSGGMSVEAIAAATGLSIEEIEQLD